MKSSALFLFAFIFLMMTLTISVYCQESEDFYTIRDKQNAYYDANPSFKDTAGSGYKDFIRWDIFWRPRVGSDSITTFPGDMRKYADALNDYVSNKDMYERSNPWQTRWQLIGPPSGIVAVTSKPFCGQVMGKITSLYVDRITDPTGKTIYAGAESSGLWKTVDHGEHWVNVTDVMPLTCGVFDITGDPATPNIIYIATGTNASGIAEYGKGIFKTTDGGLTWSNIYVPNQIKSISHRIFVNPNNGEEISILLDDKMIRSMNGGNTWETIFGDMSTPYHLTQNYTYKKKFLCDIEMKPGDPNTLYIASTGFEDWETGPHYKWHQAEIWKTSNALDPVDSIIWTRLDSTNFYPPMVSKRFELSVTPVDPNCVYVIGADTIPSSSTPAATYKKIRIYKTSDNGLSWTLRYANTRYLVDELRLELAVSPTDTSIMYIGGGMPRESKSTTMSSILQNFLQNMLIPEK